jgi:hypothetical protein
LKPFKYSAIFLLAACGMRAAPVDRIMKKPASGGTETILLVDGEASTKKKQLPWGSGDC